MSLHSPKTLTFGRTARAGVGRGIDLAGRLAGVTFGPRGRLVALERSNDSPLVTKGGFTVVRDLTADGVASLGVELVKSAVTKVHYATGDGAATASLLAAALSAAATRLAGAGIDGNRIAEGFGRARATALASLDRQRQPAPAGEALVAVVARGGSGDAELARIVAGAVTAVGGEGIVQVSFNQAVDTTVELATGMTFDHGMLFRELIPQGREEVRLERPLILLCEDALDSAADVVPALEAARAEGRALLVIAEAVTGQARATLLVNARSGTVRVAAVKGPGSGIYRREMTADIAILAGGNVLGDRLGRRPSAARPEDFARAELAVVSRRSTRIVEGAGAPEGVERRVRQLRHAHATEEKTYDRGKLAQRLARLSGGVANIRVGAHTEAEWKERQRRAEAMVQLARSAVFGGVVPGGGASLFYAAEAVRAEAAGDPVLAAFADAIGAPLARIALSAGEIPSRVTGALRAAGPAAAFDAATGSIVADAVAAGLADPLPIVTAALVGAASIAEQVARVGCVVALAPSSQSASGSLR